MRPLAKFTFIAALTVTGIYAAASTASADPTTDFNNSFGVLANQVGVAATVGSIGGGVAGMVGGCVVGAATGIILTPPIFLPGAAGGCIAGASVGAGIGAAVGTALVGVPVGIGSAIQMYSTLHAAGDIADLQR